MKFYLEALYKSFTSPSWLASQSKQTKKSAWFFVLTVLVLSLGLSLTMTFRVIPDFTQAVETVVEKELPDFHATIADDKLSISGLEQPYIKKIETEEGETATVIIDTVSTSTLSIEQFVTSSEKAILITGSQVLTNSAEFFGTTKENFSNVPNISFSKSDALDTLRNVTSAWRPMIGVITLALSFLLWGLETVVYLLLCSLLIYLVYTRTTKHPLNERYDWKEILTLSIFAFALPKLIMTAVSFGFSVAIPYVVTLAMVIAVFRALSMKKQLPEQQNSSKIG